MALKFRPPERDRLAAPSFPLPETLKTTVEGRLKALVGARAEIRHRVDPEALGGLVVQIGSKVFDHSIRHHLAQMRQAI